MNGFIRWLVEMWILRMVFRLAWRLAVIVAVVIGLASLTGTTGALKQWAQSSVDHLTRSSGGQVATDTQASMSRVEALQQPAIQLLKANWQQDQQSIHQTEPMVQSALHRLQRQPIDPAAANRWLIEKNQEDADRINETLKPINGEQ